VQAGLAPKEHDFPLAAIGGGILGLSTMLLLVYALGAVERRRWGDQPPTFKDYVSGVRQEHRSSPLELRAAHMTRRTLVIISCSWVVGLVLMIVGSAIGSR
jgi:hypothetical protein